MAGKCNVLLMADRVIREDNGKRGFIGVFNTFNVPQYPFIVPPFFIYANIEDFSTEVEFSVSIVREGSELVIHSSGGELKGLSPDGEAEIVIPVVNLQIPKEGTYTVVLNISGYQYGSRKLIVNTRPINPQGGRI